MKFLDLSTDVLAVKCIKNFVFIGVGCSLYVIDRRDSHVKIKVNALHPDNIHGIIHNSNNQLIVYGGRSLCSFNINFTEDTVNIEKSNEVLLFDDWIIDVKFSRDSDLKLLILFAHNNVYSYDLCKKQYHSTSCDETCLLYAGTISESKNGYSIIFSGTVFQEILVWEVRNDDSQNCSKVLQRLKGHKGVIFSVFYDPLNNFVCSTSDDRTVRLWKVTSEFSEIENWKNVNISLQMTMYGHIARVWKAIPMNNSIASIGEDSRICFWNFSGELLHKIEAHNGAPIWCIDISEDNTIFTGGADGYVNAWPLNNIDNQSNNYVLPKNDKDEIPKHVVFSDNCDILAYVNFRKCNRIVQYCQYQVLNTYELSEYSSTYCLMEMSLNKQQIALASINGCITLYKRTSDNEWLESEKYKITDSKIFSLHWLDIDIVLVCAEEGNLFVVQFLTHDIKVLSKHNLPQSRERWVTAATILKTLLICGDRMGSIFIYKLDSDILNPIQTFKKIHGRLGVQSCLVINYNLITTGRDGTVKFYKISNLEAEDFPINYLYSRNMPMDWVCRLLKNKNDYYVLGFKGDDFVIYSIPFKRTLAKIPCGGGHRSWDCIIYNEHIHFVFVQKKQLQIVKIPLKTLYIPPLLTGFHAKEVYSLKYLPLSTKKHKIFISGGEDCTLNISHMYSTASETKPNLKLVNSFDGHLSSIKCLSVLNLSNAKNINRNLIFSGGGRAQLKVWEISIETDGDYFDGEKIHCKDLLSYMLHGPDKERNKIWVGNELMYNVDPETRYMDLSTINNPWKEKSILVFIACSDGYLRTLSYGIELNKVEILNTHPYRNRCILKVHSFQFESQILLMTMATDGLLSFWKVVFENEKLSIQNINIQGESSLNLHQSGINSFDIKSIQDDEFMLATGGDDNLLSLLIFKIVADDVESISIEVLSILRNSSIHCAQITGIRLLHDNRILSVGADQKLALQRYSFDNSKITLISLKEMILCISDVQGLTFCEDEINQPEILCVFGKGIQILLNNENVMN